MATNDEFVDAVMQEAKPTYVSTGMMTVHCPTRLLTCSSVA